MDELTTYQAVLKTLLVSDLVGSTWLVEQLGDKRGARLFKRHDRLARDLLARSNGREIDKTDGFLLLFERPFEAVKYALEYHQALAKLTEEVGVELSSRVGIHLGEVLLRENRPEDVARGAKQLEVEGLAKPTAARLMSLASGRQTLLTVGAFDLARRAAVGADSLGEQIRWLSHGAYQFQGFEESIGVFEVGIEGKAPLTPPESSTKVIRVSTDGSEHSAKSGVPVPGTRLLDRYELSGELGRGGMGVVYRAKDPVLGREVAVKMIPPGALGPRSKERLRREAQVVARMDHPGIVTVHDFGQHQGCLFLVMPLLEGTNLRQLIRDRSLSLVDALEIAIQIAEALDYSHALGVVHRDIKPENIMVDRERSGLRVRVMDFGLALGSDESRLTGSGGFVGTVAYMSPEQLKSAPVDGRADLYALGTVLYECLAGEPPFSGTVQSLIYRIVHEYPQSLRARGIDVDRKLDEIILNCLAKEPSKRPENAVFLAKALQDCEEKLEDKTQTTLVATSGRATRLRPPAAPLVGREVEVAELQARLSAALEGECQLVLVEGDAGMGKSRLLAELEKLAVARGIRVLHGRSADHQNALPYQAFCEIVQDYFRSKESVGESSGLADLTDLALDLVALFPVLSEITELRVASTAAGGATAGTEVSLRRREATFVFELVARTLTRLAAGRPLVLMIENVHAGAIDALEYVVHRLGPTPTLLVGAYRSAEIDRGHPLNQLLRNFRDDPRFSRIILKPLTIGGFRQLVKVLVGTDQVADDLVVKLHEATEGNFFFGQELTRSLMESNAIRCDETGVWVLERRGGITAEALPATIRQAVERRIDRLPDAHRNVLAVASVLGRSFDYGDLEALLGKDTGLEDTVDALIENGILEEDRRSRGDRLIFSSGIKCDVLYRSLSRRKRRALHRRHAERLERRYAGRLERVYPHLVYHFSEGDVASKTVKYGLAQARRSLEAWGLEDAIRTCRTALEFVDEDDVERSWSARGKLLLIVAKAERMAGNLEKAFREAERAASAFEGKDEANKTTEVALFLAETAWQSGQVDVTWHWVKRGIDLARAAESVSKLKKLLMLGATVANLRGVYAKAQSFLDEVERLGPPESDSAEEQPVPSGGTLVAALPATIASLDLGVSKTDEEIEVGLNIFETLLETTEDGTLVPALCSEWAGSADSRKFRLKLRPNVLFSDGAALTANDVKSSMEYVAREGGRIAAGALSSLEGFEAFVAEESNEIPGIEVHDDLEMTFRLVNSLPIFPTLLTTPATAPIRRVSGSSRLFGTGPFRLTQSADRVGKRIVLEQNPNCWHSVPPRLDRIEFRIYSDASSIADSLRTGEIDLGRDLLPDDLEEILRDPRFRSRLVETTKKNVYFILFNLAGPVARSAALRQALAGVIRTHDLVWRALGRFAQPAVSLIPPGVLGHDPGRRRQTLSKRQARDLMARDGLGDAIQLRASIHPMIHDRYGSLTAALLKEWSELSVEVVNVTPKMEDYLLAYQETREIDLKIGRWVDNFGDPDGFTRNLFHTRDGLLRRYYSSSQVDRLLEQARQEKEPADRQTLYQSFEDLLEEDSVLVPLFHDVNYRIASPRVRGLSLSNSSPYVNYETVGKVEIAADGIRAVHTESGGRGEIRIALHTRVETLDPAVGPQLRDYTEVRAGVFETLTRVEEGARIIPWLATSFEGMEGGRCYRFRLREDVRFHDGRRLSARDVRYSLERLLRVPNRESHPALTPIRGARALRDGRARELSGLRILSAREFLIDLERPFPFFPASMAQIPIVPEGAENFAGRWSEGCVGTGPFRVSDFWPGKRLELERNPDYWRTGFPRSSSLIFQFGGSPEQWCDDFRRGKLTLAAELLPADVEALRRDPRYAEGYLEEPRLGTYLLVLNNRRPPFSDPGLRRAFAEAVDIAAALQGTAGRLVRPARGLIPPGLLGYEPARESTRMLLSPYPVAPKFELKAEYTPPYAGQYSALWERLCGLWSDTGFEVKSQATVLKELPTRLSEGAPDLPDFFACRWFADYPDADGIVGNLLHSSDGYFGPCCSTPEIDRLIEAGRAESAPSLRHAIYREIEEVIAREALVVPLFHEQAYRFCAAGVGGLRLILAGIGDVRYEEIYIRR